MYESVELQKEFRVWLRARIKEVLGDKPENRDFVTLPVKELTQICIEEFYRYQVQKNWPTAQKTTAEMLEISREWVSRTIKKSF